MASPLSSAQQPMGQAFFDGVHATKIVTAAPFRAQASTDRFTPTGGAQRQDSFLEGALSKAGLLSAKR